jgi:peptidoglycan/xylan/chitin deacetylase (PgdA/CDA1 family)
MQTVQKSKRERFANFASTIRLTRMIEALPKRPIIMGLSYHRIGDGSTSEYDSGVYSATAEEFDAQLAHLKKRFTVLTPEEVLNIATGHAPARSGVFLSFDDGYIDNYEVAFPVLRHHGLSATFFLATSYVGTSYVPWWDRIAYVVKHANARVIRLSYPHQVDFDIDALGLQTTCLKVLRLYRHAATTDPDRFERELMQACRQECPSFAETPRFLDWTQAREMLHSGMAFGSHTHTHHILSKLTAEEQLAEVQTSREIMQRELQVPIDVLAYPVGSRHTFSEETVKALKTAGYRAAYSHYGGENRVDQIDAFDIRREPVSGVSHSRFRLQTALRATMGTIWS